MAKSDLALDNSDRAPGSAIAGDRGVEVGEPTRHPYWQTFPTNIALTCKELREPAGQFGKSMVLCAQAAVTIEKLAEQREDLVAACVAIRKVHEQIFPTGRALVFDDGKPFDHTKLNEACRLAQDALAKARAA